MEALKHPKANLKKAFSIKSSGFSSTMVNTCRISFIIFMILLLFINQSALSSSVRIGLQEGRDLVCHRTLDEIERADKARLSFFCKLVFNLCNIFSLGSYSFFFLSIY
ncbi:hypothetical protein ISN44_As07g012260 [Arabidopsis suecica]|uniref:Uncharacterized protein n=1 Tax=Arabidopsis suecica TaxID=45249 RepID=A0A8T2BPX1_ARASU|nr:hypothetical protein ISN44_As07g012260 [Arabidopsis suecica]